MGKKLFFGIFLGILLLGNLVGCGSKTAGYLVAGSETEGMDAQSEAGNGTTETEPTFFYVYVCGAVEAPGVYMLEEGCRIFDLFAAAGGLLPEAAEDFWNQARKLADGEMIYVPTEEEASAYTPQEKEEAAGMYPGAADREDTNGKINLNTASKEELMTLPGIGESKALAILSYREKLGGFSGIEDIKQIAGIKDAVFSKIEDYIEVN